MAKKLGILESLQGKVKAPGSLPAPSDESSAEPVAKMARGGRPKKADPSASFTIGLPLSLRQELTELAAKHGVARNALTIFFIKYGIEQVKSNKLKLPITKEPKLRI